MIHIIARMQRTARLHRTVMYAPAATAAKMHAVVAADAGGM
jgi:hypothetical protein